MFYPLEIGFQGCGIHGNQHIGQIARCFYVPASNADLKA